MSYVVLARKWRPQNFADLVGQEHVSRTLQNAIDSGRIAHAFLFTGVRGVGKTTSARILAKALNCLRPPGTVPAGQDPGPTGEPCLVCAACREIAQGTDLDVQEIDGASYNGVDEIRSLQDALPYRPARDRYKLFIIDEVHMLSGSAWNAFLKTLEEPPPHVKFILATTESHKIPITILSRVQRFDFRMISLSAIVQRLRYVLDQEKIAAEDAALSILAREAAGSMRDAMSLLDQVLAYNAKSLSADDVAKVLGVASHQVLYSLTTDLLRGNAEGCVRVVTDLSNQGFNIASVTRDLLSLLRDLVVSKVCAQPEDLLDLPDQERQDVKRLAAAEQADDLIRLHQGFSRGVDDVLRGGQPRAALEMLLIRLARRPALVPIEEWLSRLAALEQRLAPHAGTPTGGAGSAGPQQRTAVPATAQATPAPAPPRVAPASAMMAPAVTVVAPAAPAMTAPAPAAPAAVTPAAPPALQQSKAPATAARSSNNLELWSVLLDKIREARPELASVLQHVVPLRLDAKEMTLGIEKGSVFEQKLSSTEMRNVLQKVATEHFHSTPKLTVQASGALAGEPTLAAQAADARSVRRQEATQRAKQHPRVVEAIEILGGRIKDVRPAED